MLLGFREALMILLVDLIHVDSTVPRIAGVSENHALLRVIREESRRDSFLVTSERLLNWALFNLHVFVELMGLSGISWQANGHEEMKRKK